MTRKCKHKRLTDYYAHGQCTNGLVGCSGWSESRCADCGMFITDEPCGGWCNVSGWSMKRWRRYRQALNRKHEGEYRE